MKNLIFAILTVSLIAVIGINAFAVELNSVENKQKTMESVRGNVVSVEPNAFGSETEGTSGYKIQIEDSESAPYTFTITNDSYNAAEAAPADIKPGDSFVGWYDPAAVTIMIYPPQYHAVVYAVNMDSGIAAVDIFTFNPNGNMTSRGGDLILNMENNVTEDGMPIYGPEIDGKLLVVYSDIIMESFPAQTVPKKIVALDYELYAAEAANWESGYYVNGVMVDTPTGYSVNGVKIDAPMYYGNEYSEMMIPLRPVAEAMGYTVHWESEMKAAILNNSVTITIGSKDYSVARMAPISLNSAAEIIDGRTYVPHTFFSEVLNAEVDITESGELWRVDITTVKNTFSFQAYFNLLGMSKQELLEYIDEEPISIDESGLEFSETGISVWLDENGAVSQAFTQREDIDFMGAKIGDDIKSFRSVFGESLSDKNGDMHFAYEGAFISANYDTETGKIYAVYLLNTNF